MLTFSSKSLWRESDIRPCWEKTWRPSELADKNLTDYKICDGLMCSIFSPVGLFDSMDCTLPISSVHAIFPTKNIGAGCHFLLQRIFRTQRSNPCLLHVLHWQADLPLFSLGKPEVTTLSKHNFSQHQIRSLFREDIAELSDRTYSKVLKIFTLLPKISLIY